MAYLRLILAHVILRLLVEKLLLNLRLAHDDDGWCALISKSFCDKRLRTIARTDQ